MDERRVVYVLRSDQEPACYYVGLTMSFETRGQPVDQHRGTLDEERQ